MVQYAPLWPAFAAIVGAIATVGAVWAAFVRLKQDVADHTGSDEQHFAKIYDLLGDIRERLSALDGGPHGKRPIL